MALSATKQGRCDGWRSALSGGDEEEGKEKKKRPWPWTQAHWHAEMAD